MRRSLMKKPSPGVVLACVALFVALGGGAYAATSSDTKTDKKIAKKAAKSYFNGHIAGASVSHASTAGSATSATNATNANHANTADSAQPEAFALVDGSTATVSNAKGITNANITHPHAGTYCITGLSFAIKGAQVTPEFEGNYGETAMFSPGTTGFCPNGDQVVTAGFDSGTKTFGPEDLTFNVVLYG
jgi:hypothetical protein